MGVQVASLLHDDVLDQADTRRGVRSLNFVMGNKVLYSTLQTVHMKLGCTVKCTVQIVHMQGGCVVQCAVQTVHMKLGRTLVFESE